MTNIELGWIAGIIDGEGCIGVNIRRDRNRSTPDKITQYVVRVTVANTDKRIIDKLNGLFPGYAAKRGYTGTQDRAQAYVWCITHKTALEFLKVVKPYLISKNYQAELAIQLQQRISERKGYEVPKRNSKGQTIGGLTLTDQEKSLRAFLVESLQRLNVRGKARELVYESYASKAHAGSHLNTDVKADASSAGALDPFSSENV